jgi:hypothetical protein
MSNWKNIRLELASTAEFPRGSVSRGYLLRLPLNDSDLVDQPAFERKPHWATVRRYWSGEPDANGVLARSEGAWAMRLDGNLDRRLDLDDRPLRLGQRVYVADPGATPLPFRVASIR